MGGRTITANKQVQATSETAFGVILAISFCHLLNDMMQALLPAIYPNLKAELGLTFGQIGIVTLAYQVTASILQPMIGLYADKRPTPMALPFGTLFSLAGLAVLSVAHTYGLVVIGACLLGMGSSVFHPESSRVARMAAGGRHGLAQSLFQVGGNAGSALGPLAAAVVVVRWGQSSLMFFALLALLAGGILWNVAGWYRTQGLARMRAAAKGPQPIAPPSRQVVTGISILLALIFSKYVYLASLTNYLTFYMMEKFGSSVQGAQMHLFLFLGAVAAGTVAGGPLGDRFGRKYVIWFSILGVLPFSLLLPFAGAFWTGPLVVIIGLILASAFPAIVVFAQELAPGKVGMMSGLLFGFSFGMGGLGAAILGVLADKTGIETVYRLCAFLPAIGLLAAFLPKIEKHPPLPPTPPGLEPEAL
ncbi:MAG: MFS transporter [Phenylobacterium sp.]|uniref:MFS transporter n=1 Tax=Phenylobacterium sp. TaxID=1871053 RepID=UPI0025FD10AE|nr:MFS transporter [Phenylobacterium sp.]MBA4013505.1 MFS transporter [Phenylobacterium sp.]